MDSAPSAYTGPTTPGARSRTFSFRSDQSGGSRQKEDLVESPKEKQRKDLIWKQGSKANPNSALNEAQPGVNAILEESTLTPLRGIQHKDAYGNVITDPDASNPTRPRLERPLDTIRSFERAIDNGYKRRSSYNRSEAQDPGSQYSASRRNSAYGGHDSAANSNRFPNGNGGGYYGNRGPDGYGPGPTSRSRHPASRMNSEPMMYGGQQRPYSQSHQFSQDTINTGGSDSTGVWANSTDPSSENSSVERGPSAQKPYGDNGYPSNGYGQNGHAQQGYGGNGYGNTIPEEGGYPSYAPPVQHPNGPATRRPIPLGGSNGMLPPTSNLPSTRRPEPEKRKSWLKRTFSRKESN